MNSIATFFKQAIFRKGKENEKHSEKRIASRQKQRRKRKWRAKLQQKKDPWYSIYHFQSECSPEPWFRESIQDGDYVIVANEVGDTLFGGQTRVRIYVYDHVNGGRMASFGTIVGNEGENWQMCNARFFTMFCLTVGCGMEPSFGTRPERAYHRKEGRFHERVDSGWQGGYGLSGSCFLQAHRIL